MKVNNRTISYVILLLSTILIYICFNKNSMGTICFLLAAFLGLLNISKKTIVELMPSLIMAIVAIVMLVISGRINERGFNAPIGNEQKFIFVFFVQCAAVAMRRLDKGKKRKIVVVTFSTIFISCLVSIFYTLTQDKYAIRYYESRGFANVMDFDQSYAVPFAFTLVLYLVVYRNKDYLKKKKVSIAFLVVSAYFAFVSLYTTALLFVVLGIVMCFVPTLYRKSPSQFYFFLLIVVILIIIGMCFNQQISDCLYKLTENLNWIVKARVRSVIDTIFQTNHGNWYNTERRDELASYSLNTFRANPIFGVGYFGYGYGVIGCHQEWYDMLGVFGIVGFSCILLVLIYNTYLAYQYAKTRMDKDALIISVIMLFVLGFLNPCLSKQLLFIVFVVAPNISTLLSANIKLSKRRGRRWNR